jgi:tripartite-type tricarboxylate transporter receptor subunit TctC
MGRRPVRLGHWGVIVNLARRRFLYLAAGAAALPAVQRIARAQAAYPTRPVIFIEPLPAGSAPDIQIRVIAAQFAKLWGQQAIVEDRPGGGGRIATQAVLSARPDGYTLLAAVGSIFTVLPAQREKLNFDVNRDLIPIGLTANQGMVIAVSSKLGVNTLGELIAMAKKEPNQLIIGTNPAGSLPHLAALLLARQSGAQFVIVPSTRGTNEAISEIMGGRQHIVIDAPASLQGALNAGNLKPLAIMDSERTPTMPDLPTATETIQGLVALGWSGVFARKETPSDVVKILTDGLRKVVESSETRTQLARVGALPFRPRFGEDLSQFIEGEQKLWWPIVNEELN